MERTDELKERIRQQPLNDRLEESRRRIGDMCSKGRCPKMTIPVQHDDDDFYINTTLADAQATVEALQAQLPAEMQGCTILFKECEKGHGRLVATNWRDHGCQTCEVEALQRERDEWRRSAEAHLEVDEIMARDHQMQLDAEREKVKELEQQVQDQSTSNLEIMRHTDDMQSRALDAEHALAHLQALVQALPVLPESDLHLDEVSARLKRGNIGIDLILNLLKYRATLDATTPARKEATVSEVMAGPTEHLVARSDYETLRDERDRLLHDYHELIMAVETKYPGETRHQTALKYIRRAEESCNIPEQAATTPAGGEGN